MGHYTIGYKTAVKHKRMLQQLPFFEQKQGDSPIWSPKPQKNGV